MDLDVVFTFFLKYTAFPITLGLASKEKTERVLSFFCSEGEAGRLSWAVLEYLLLCLWY